MIKRFQMNDTNPHPEQLQSACQVLREGGLVIVPTETVYGVACDPSVPGALEKLIMAKGRDGDKPIARLAADSAQVKHEALEWPPGLQALTSTYWPGPLTIVLKTKQGWTGYRVPAHAVPFKLAKLCGNTLALTSANLSGEPDTTTAQQAASAIAADLILDSGPSAQQAIPSTVIKIDGQQIECLREGILPFSEVKQIFKEATP